MQMISARDYRGERVRFSGELAAQDVGGHTGFWMRVDAADSDRPLAFDNMDSRPVRGTADWNRHDVVLDVAEDAAAIAFGVLLAGTGEIAVRALRFEVVPASVPVTGGAEFLPRAPQNLDFAAPVA